VYTYQRSKTISVINTDNLYPNGAKLKELTKKKISTDEDNLIMWLDTNVTFHNSMVDRITSYRQGDESVPRAEPLPYKALVIEDINDRLNPVLKTLKHLGVHICSETSEIIDCINFKLMIANATHTCMVYSMAMSGLCGTSGCLENRFFFELIDGIFYQDILMAFEEEKRNDVLRTYKEWSERLKHPYFEMSTFFICQNATQKLRKKNCFYFQVKLNRNIF